MIGGLIGRFCTPPGISQIVFVTSTPSAGYEVTSMTNSFIRICAVMQRTALSGSAIYEQAARGEFPTPINIGTRASAWLECEVEGWLDARIRESRGGVSTHSDCAGCSDCWMWDRSDIELDFPALVDVALDFGWRPPTRQELQSDDDARDKSSREKWLHEPGLLHTLAPEAFGASCECTTAETYQASPPS